MPDKVLNTPDNFFQQVIAKMVKFSNISAVMPSKYLPVQCQHWKHKSVKCVHSYRNQSIDLQSKSIITGFNMRVTWT